MTTCLRPDCYRPTVYGSPACDDHWQAWRDEDQERIIREWDLGRVESEVEQEQIWLHRREQMRGVPADPHDTELEASIEREGRFAQDIRDADG